MFYLSFSNEIFFLSYNISMEVVGPRAHNEYFSYKILFRLFQCCEAYRLSFERRMEALRYERIFFSLECLVLM